LFSDDIVREFGEIIQKGHCVIQGSPATSFEPDIVMEFGRGPASSC